MKKDVGGKSCFLRFKKFSLFFSKKNATKILNKPVDTINNDVIYSSHVHLVHIAVNRRIVWLDLFQDIQAISVSWLY